MNDAETHEDMSTAEDLDRNAIEREWPLDEDGFPHRAAARVLALRPDGAAYLIRGHDADTTDFWWWFTPGGGIESGENARDAAVRELREETGLEVSVQRLVGTVLKRQAIFNFVGSTRKQDEEFFLLYVNWAEAEAMSIGQGQKLTALEKHLLDGAAWLMPDELRAAQERGENVFPLCLPDVIERWKKGWDGTLVTLDHDENKPFL